MSENTKPSRTIPEIQQEYTNLCTKVGQLQYHIYTLEKDLEMANSSLRDLNLEAASVKGAEETAKAEAAKSAESAPNV